MAKFYSVKAQSILDELERDPMLRMRALAQGLDKREISIEETVTIVERLKKEFA